MRVHHSRFGTNVHTQSPPLLGLWVDSDRLLVVAELAEAKQTMASQSQQLEELHSQTDEQAALSGKFACDARLPAHLSGVSDRVLAIAATMLSDLRQETAEAEERVHQLINKVQAQASERMTLAQDSEDLSVTVSHVSSELEESRRRHFGVLALNEELQVSHPHNLHPAQSSPNPHLILT